MYIILVILFFFFLIIRHTINRIGNYIEGFCSDTGSSKDACKEIENNMVSVKNMETGHQEDVKVEDLVAYIKK